MSTSLRCSMEFPVDCATAFDRLVEDLSTALDSEDLRARASDWQPGKRILFILQGIEGAAEAEFAFRALDHGCVLTVDLHDWSNALGPGADVAGWFAAQIAAPLLRALSPAAIGSWITDRVARKPTGREARATYRDPLFHYPNFRVILEELALTRDDRLLEVACGGGALLRECLLSGCTAAAIDHSMDMVRTARDVNRDAIAAGRLHVVRAAAERLPFSGALFTRAAMTGVLGFFADPVAVLAEIHRALLPAGQLVALGSDPEMKGTPAAPEPIASHLHFYGDEELAALGRDAGFAFSRVIHRDLEPHARAVGVPDDLVPLFAGVTRFLIAEKSS